VTRTTIDSGNRLYTIAPDDPGPLGDRQWGVVRARLVDELTGEPPRGPVRVDTTRRFLVPRIAADGVVGLAGVPERALPALRTSAYDVPLTVDVAGYVERRAVARLGPQPTFPTTFAPADIGDLLLHREPVVIRGRAVVVAAGAVTPAAGATITVTGVWRTLPSANVAVPPDPPNLVSLRPPLYAARVAATASLAACAVAAPGPLKTLLADAPRGADQLRLSDQLNIGTAPGMNQITFDDGDPDTQEFATITAIAAASTPDQPATVTIAFPIAHRHRRGTVVRPVTLAPAAGNPVGRDAATGDTTVFLNALAGLPIGVTTVVEVGGGGVAQPEYHLLERYETTCDADGSFRLPPISRVAQLDIQADDGAHPPVNQIVAPDYQDREYVVAFTLA